MAYLAARDIQFGKPVSSFIDARDNARKNALLEQEAASQMAARDAQQQNALFQQQRLTEADQVAAQERQQASQQDQHKKLFTAMQSLAAVSNDPVKFQGLSQRLFQDPEIGQVLAGNGVTPEDVTPANVQELLAASGVRIGQGPAAPPITYTRESGPRGSVLQIDSTGKATQLVAPDNTQPPNYANGGGYRSLTPAEVATAGLPPGTSAQRGPDGKIDVLSKRDNTGVLSQKDASTAKMKLNTVALARSQLQKIKEAFDEGRKGVNAFGPGQGLMPTQAGKKFDARVDQMRSTLTALTRVPGVGAMSDYETKLDQSKFPSRNAYESVTQDVINNLEDQLSLIENGYRGLLSGGVDAAQPPAAPSNVAAPSSAPPVNQRGWKLHTDAQGNKAYVSPDGRQFEEVR